jgi:hypothetical protein
VEKTRGRKSRATVPLNQAKRYYLYLSISCHLSQAKDLENDAVFLRTNYERRASGMYLLLNPFPISQWYIKARPATR